MRHWHPFFTVHLLYINIGTYCRIRTYVYRYVLSNTYLRLLLWNIKIDKNDRKSISDNNLLNNNVNTVDLYQISPVILSSFLGIPSEFLGNRWQYYWRHLQKIHCILSIRWWVFISNNAFTGGYWILLLSISTCKCIYR